MKPRRRRLKVVLRRSHVAYQWRLFFSAAAWLLKWLFFAGSAAACAWGAQRLWRESPGLRVERLVVEGPAPSGLAERSGLAAGRPLFSFSAREVAQNLENQFPELAAVHVRRGLDKSVHLSVSYRRAVAKAMSNGRWMAVDPAGAFFPSEAVRSDLVIFAGAPPGPAAARLAAFLAALKSTGEPWTAGLYKIRISSDEELTLFLTGDIPVFWGPWTGGEDVVRRRAARLERVMLDPALADGASSIRFVEDHRIVVKPKKSLLGDS